MSARRTALVTGASSGIGRAVAEALAERGYRTVGTSRNPGAITADARLDAVEYLPLDLEDPASVEACAAAAGDVDVLVNNAGESQVGALEELPDDAIRRLFELNVFGPVRLTQLFAPGMRERGYGRVVMVGSMLGSFPLAFRSSYGASKAAIKAFADGARFELSPFGVWLTTVEPGAINTGISSRRTKYLADGSPYAGDYDSVLSTLDANELRGPDAEDVARLVMRAIEARRPRPLYAVGSSAPLAFAAKRALPSTLMERIVARRHDLRR
jgi:NAD(P)-dependent dehydrogenase (short-subunit alcohol dehydrogenase family)